MKRHFKVFELNKVRPSRLLLVFASEADRLYDIYREAAKLTGLEWSRFFIETLNATR